MNLSIKISIFFCAIILLSGSFFSSCTTEKNAFLNKKYHYITARFNGYFNGNESYKEAKNNIAERHKDDFDEILDVFKYGNATDNKDQFSNLDRAMTKGAKMIDRHSMKFKVKSEEVEFNQIIDDCYLLIGKARFLKHDFNAAKETFLYIKNSYETGKEKDKANLWLVMTYIYQENFVDAETTLKAIKSSIEEEKDKAQKFPKQLMDDLALVEAIYLKRSGQFELAIPAFELAVSKLKKRALKQRIQYILAQLYQQQGNMSKASDLYRIVAKKATSYELQFNAKISLATTYEGNSKEVIDILENMLKDIKNKEYQDQIFYALAKVYENQGLEEAAIRNYKLAAKTSVSNFKQKGKSFLALGNYYFDKASYILASDYYDSTLTVITKDFPNFEEIKSKKESLVDLVKHLKVVKVQDSLLHLVNMSEEERTRFIDEKIKIAKARADELKALQEVEREKAIANASVQGAAGANWIFDNPSLLVTGLAQFKGLWGDRILEDHWRRSDKSSLSFDQISQDEGADFDDVEGGQLPEDQRPEFYLKDLPFDNDQQAVSNQLIMDAYYQLGVLYRDNFSDLPRSTYYFNQLNSRYPRNLKEAEAWYQLYRNYDKMNQLSKKNEVKQKVIKNYPTSELAQLLLHPNMLAEQEQKYAEQEQAYEKIFSLYEKEKYSEVLQAVVDNKKKVIGGDLAGRFNLIYAFTQGNLFGKDSLEYYLKRVMEENTGTLAASEAGQLLSRMKKDNAIAIGKKLAAESKAREFISSEKEVHYYMMIFGNELNNTKELSLKLSDVNMMFYSTKMLQSKSIKWSENEDAIIVKPFKTKSEALDYYETIEQKILNDKKTLGDLNFIISKTNYSTLIKYKDILPYMDFFKKHYSNKN